MIRKAMRAVAVTMCALAVLGTAGVAAAVDAPRWVAALYVEQQKMVGLRWMPVPGATGYKVFRTTTPGKDQQEIAAAATPQYLDTAVEPGNTYYYSLKTVAGADLSPASDEKSVVIPGAKKSGVETPELDSVTLQVVMEFGKPVYKVGVIWHGKGPAIAFNLYRSLQAGKPGDMISSSQEPRYIDVAVEPGKTYFYTVSALDASFQETKLSAEKSVEVKVQEVVEQKKIVKKEYPKLVPIPAEKGPPIRVPSDPSDLDIDDEGTIYVLAGYVYELADGIDGELKQITSELFTTVSGIGIGPDGELLLAVDNSTKVLVRTGKTKYREIELPKMTVPLKNENGKEIRMQEPKANDITMNVDGKVWVTDNPNSRVLIFDDDFTFLGAAAAGTPGELVPQADSIAHDSKGNVFVASGSTNYVNIYDKDGTLTGQFGETGNIAGTFGRIAGVWVDKEDNLWITDVFNGTVQKFDNTGKFLGSLSGPDKKSGFGAATPSAVIITDKAGRKGIVSEGINRSIIGFTILEK